MSRWVVFVAVALVVSPPLESQTTSAELLGRAKELYARLEIERAVPLLRQLLSPGWPFEFSTDERVQAYTYLGAALALSGRPDSALIYFRAAIEWDPFTDLDPARFTPEQLRLFADARRRTFAIGLRPLVAARVDPRTERVRFTLVTTHAARVSVSLRRPDSTPPALLYEEEADGLKEVAWDGLIHSTTAQPGRYELLVSAISTLSRRRDSARTFFDLRHEFEPLEDSVPVLPPGALLPERVSPRAAGKELLKGLGVAAGVLLISHSLDNSGLRGSRTPGTVFAGAAALTGLGAFAWRVRHPELAQNVAENLQRQAARRAANDSIRARNAERMSRRVLIITPAAGIEP